MTIEVPEDVCVAIEDEAVREFRTPPQQASYLLLIWAREQQTRRQKTEKAAPGGMRARGDEVLNGAAV
jgi:hypothetical protein